MKTSILKKYNRILNHTYADIKKRFRNLSEANIVSQSVVMYYKDFVHTTWFEIVLATEDDIKMVEHENCVYYYLDTNKPYYTQDCLDYALNLLLDKMSVNSIHLTGYNRVLQDVDTDISKLSVSDLRINTAQSRTFQLLRDTMQGIIQEKESNLIESIHMQQVEGFEGIYSIKGSERFLPILVLDMNQGIWKGTAYNYQTGSTFHGTPCEFSDKLYVPNRDISVDKVERFLYPMKSPQDIQFV